MTPREWFDGHPWDGNGGAFGELACWRISLALYGVVVCVLGIAVHTTMHGRKR